MGAATEMSTQLKKQLGECDTVVRRLSKIAIAARPSTANVATEPEFAQVGVAAPALSATPSSSVVSTVVWMELSPCDSSIRRE